MPLAANRGEILDKVVDGKSAVIVSDSINPLHWFHYQGQIDGIEQELDNDDLLLDMQTANVMRMVRNAISKEAVVKFDALSWSRASKIAWNCVK